MHLRACLHTAKEKRPKTGSTSATITLPSTINSVVHFALPRFYFPKLFSHQPGRRCPIYSYVQVRDRGMDTTNAITNDTVLQHITAQSVFSVAQLRALNSRWLQPQEALAVQQVATVLGGSSRVWAGMRALGSLRLAALPAGYRSATF